MKIFLRILAAAALASACAGSQVKLSTAYEELPLGAVRPQGWLEEMLLRQRDGITATLDELYPEVLGEDNGWLGGEGDRWERGPYWIDGLVPLAYILDDDDLKAKAQRWVEWALASQREDGFFGPDKGYPYIEGLQRGLPLDWWPRIVVLKFMQQYWSATGDERVPDFFGKYFRYQLETLPGTPLDKWTYWARYRACDNLDMVLWYYGLSGEKWLLELADILHSQSFDFTGEFLRGDMLSTPGSIHCVNLAQGIKEPVIYWQKSHDTKYLEAAARGLRDLDRFNGFPNGMFGGDEALHGNVPTQGSELCSAVELMYSLERMLAVSGDLRYADRLERIAFNALPAQISDDFRWHQYLQIPNQISVKLGIHNFDVGYKGTGQVFGLLTGYPCCTTNQHQGWPKFTRNLWYSTPDGGLAALVYSPCRVSASIAGSHLTISEETAYPMDGRICLKISLSASASFPLELRIPSWCEEAVLRVNGERIKAPEPGSIARIERLWEDGDTVELDLPMKTVCSRWNSNSAAVERGPLVYALGLQEQWKAGLFDGSMAREFGRDYYEVSSSDSWNYGLLKQQALLAPESMEVMIDSAKLSSRWFWSLEYAPVRIKVKASRIPAWKEYDGDTGPLPWSQAGSGDVNDISANRAGRVEELSLIPYGCTTLRISEFPILTH